MTTPIRVSSNAKDTDAKVLSTELGTPDLAGALPGEGFVYEEPNSSLRGVQGMRTFRRMADDDPVVGAMLWALESILRHVKFEVVAADSSDEAMTKKEWVQKMLFVDMKMPFNDVVCEALSMLTYGFAPFEIVYKIDDEGFLAVDRLAPRGQTSVFKWYFTNHGALLGLEQMTVGKPSVTIPWYKLLNFRTQSRKDNPEGRSILRNAWKTWRRKEQVEDAEGRAALRAAGIAEIRVPSRYLKSAVYGGQPEDIALGDQYKRLADKLAQDRQGSVVLPSDRDQSGNYLVDFVYKVADGQRNTDMSTIVDRFDHRIAGTILAEFIFLGEGAVGSRALGDSKNEMFLLGASSIMDGIADTFTRVLLNRLWVLNGWDLKTRPTIKTNGLDKIDLNTLASFIKSMAGAGAELFPNPKLQEKLLELADLNVDDGQAGG